MAYANHNTATNQSRTKWVATPLNKKGDLNSWLSRMTQACPNPVLGEIVWLSGYSSRTAYKAMGFKSNGEAVWQRGEVVKH
mgnify:CR=1 FL=1